MKLLFVTQVIDGQDAVLGFVVRWVQGLAKHCERVRVLALEAGDLSDLPDNVDVRVIGRRGVLRRLLRYRSFLKEAFARDGFDTLLTHMVPRYSVVAGGLARKYGVGHFLWYTHKGVDKRLIGAEKVVSRIFTAGAESMRLDTPKKRVTGHGIDLDHFDSAGVPPELPTRLLAVGRMTPAKDPTTLVEAVALLVERGHDLHLDLVGGGLAQGDDGYIGEVRGLIARKELQERVHLHGATPYRDIAAYYRRCTLLLSPSMTGSIDKVVLEAMAAGRPVVTCNESFPPILAELGEQAQALLFEQRNAAQLAQRVDSLLRLPQAERDALGARLRGIVARDHQVDTLMQRLVTEMSESHA